MNNTHLKYTQTIWNKLYTAFRTYITLMLKKKMANSFLFSLFSLPLFHPIFSLVCQGLHLRWWYSTPHIFHHLFMTLLYSHSLHISTRNICKLFFSAQYLKGQSAYLKGEEYPQQIQSLISPINSSSPQCLTFGFANISKSVYHYSLWYHLRIIKPAFCQCLVSKTYLMEK